MTGPSDQVRMDHVAVASHHAWDQVTRYHHQLAGRWLGGPALGSDSAFFFCQVEFEGGTKIEMLEPTAGAGSDFLRRFLDRNGPGPHHFTFKVKDFDAAVSACAAAGYDIVGSDRSDADWHEAFLHPKQSHGIVIQLAYQGDRDTGWEAVEQLPPARGSTTPTLSAVEHLVADLESAVKLFAGPLAMDQVDRWSDVDGESAMLRSGPWRLRLIQPARPDWQHWLGPRAGRLLQLCFTVADPSLIPGIEAAPGGCYQLRPEDNLGTRLLLRVVDDA